MTITQISQELPPPEIRDTPVNWLKKNLFAPWYNGVITVVIVSIFSVIGYSFFHWAFTKAQWTVIPKNISLFLVGRYPSQEYWRLWVMGAIIALGFGLSWGVIMRNAVRLWRKRLLIGIALVALFLCSLPVPFFPFRLLSLGLLMLVIGGAWGGQKLGRKIPALGQYLTFGWFISFIIFIWLIGGGLGLKVVETNEWGGLMLTILMAAISILLCFPIGVAMALGRQSTLPVVRLFSVLYIEVIRGVPLIAILFMGQVMIPLFLPEGMRPDRVLRAILGLTIFSSAYLAENVRGGLQAIPRGQGEAAQALGLSPPLVVGLVVLPQALKAVIPAIVGQFISLFQDTTLLSIVGLEEFLGMSGSILANPNYIGRYGEVYLVVAITYWFFCYAMSEGSKRLEATLNTEHR